MLCERKWILAFAATSAAVVLGANACSSPDLSSTNFACAKDSDCAAGSVCGSLANGARACVQAPAALPEAGATEAGADASTSTPIHLGMSTALSGTSGDLGTQMSRGVRACFEAVNKAGGIRGRTVDLVIRDDAYDPAKAIANTNALLDVTQSNPDPAKPDTRGPNGVIALIGNVGTPTMTKSAPIAIKNGVLFFAPFTGAQTILRDGTKSPYVFNYRAGYYDETRAMLALFKRKNGNVRPPLTNVIVFAQNDTYGDAGYNGMKNAFAEDGLPAETLKRVNYTRDDLTSVAAAVTEVTAALAGVDETKPVAIPMIDTYQIGAAFIRALKNELANGTNATTKTKALARSIIFINVSFVGSEGLQEELGKPPTTYKLDGADVNLSENVWVTQVVPSYESLAPGVAQYRKDIQDLDSGKVGFVSLEGHIACRLFAEGLKRNMAEQTPDNLIKTFESMGAVDLGIGTPIGFTAAEHQASQQVWYSSFGGEDLKGDPMKYFITLKWNKKTGIETE
jgi:ABC-type branched-subunit amino acid transport system substrate-binding protein